MKSKVIENQAKSYCEFNAIFTPEWIVKILLQLKKDGQLTKKQLKQELEVTSKQLDKKLIFLQNKKFVEKKMIDKVSGKKLHYQLTNEGKFQAKNKILKEIRRNGEYKRRVKKLK